MLGAALTRELAMLAHARARVCILLGRGFDAPTDELVAQLWRGAFSMELRHALQSARAPYALFDIEALAGSGTKRAVGALARVLCREHTRLFVGPHALPAPPYESVYREPGWGVMGETTLAVRRAYEAAGFGLEAGVRELPDHIAVELEFLARLAEEEAEAWDVQDEARALWWLEHEGAFLERHLGQWLSTFAERVIVTTTSPFYSGLACIARGFVLHVQGQVSGLLEALNMTGAHGERRSFPVEAQENSQGEHGGGA